MTVIDLVIQLQKLNQNLRVMIDVPHMGDMFKFVDIVDVSEAIIKNSDNIEENVVIISPYQIKTEEN